MPLLSYDQCQLQGQRSSRLHFSTQLGFCSLPWDLQSALSIQVSWPVTGLQSDEKGQISRRGTSASEKAFGVLALPALPSSFAPCQAKESCHLLGLLPLLPALHLQAGPGTACLALNENSLESYLRLFQENLESPAHKYLCQVSVRTGVSCMGLWCPEH